ncbi:MAG: type III PLP-dependent enzyme [Candidatus Saganbacteria bacterium]|nr:type III PLP-dependent enzyme [Candidatus Saganbacteria bacterium]
MISLPKLKRLAEREGTPLLVIDHDVVRANYQRLHKQLPRLDLYFAIKSNPEPQIISTLYAEKSGYDVASLQEYEAVLENIPTLRGKKRDDFIWDKIIVANTIKPAETLKQLANYNTLMTFDNRYELEKIKEHCPDAGLVCRLRVQNVGSVVELSSKFGVEPGDAPNLIEQAFELGLSVEGLSFHVGSQCTNIENYLNALEASAQIFKEVKQRGHKLRLLNIGGGFPVPYDGSEPPFEAMAKKLRKEIDRLFPKHISVVAEPGRFIVATAATLVVEVVGKSFRDDKWVYYVNDGVYGTLSGVIFDHIPYHFNAFKRGDKRLSAVVGPTCDALDTVSTAEMLPELNLGDLLYVRNCGAYTNGSATTFNGFPKAKILNINT